MLFIQTILVTVTLYLLATWRTAYIPPKDIRDLNSEVYFTRGYRWILTLEAQIPVTAVILAIFLAITCTNPTYIFLDALAFKPEARLVCWCLNFAFIGFVYNAIQYSRTSGVFPKNVPILLWTILGIGTFWCLRQSETPSRQSSLLGRYGVSLIGYLSILTAFLWCVVTTPLDQRHLGNESSISSPLSDPLLPSQEEADTSELLDDRGIFNQWFFRFATPFFQGSIADVHCLPPPKPEEQVKVQWSRFNAFFDPKEHGTNLGTATWAYMKDNLIHNSVLYFVGIQFQLMNAIVLNCFFDALRHHTAVRTTRSLGACITWAMAIGTCLLGDVVQRHRTMFQGWRYGIWLDAVYSAAIYRKSLRVSVGEMRTVVKDSDESDDGSCGGDKTSKGRLINMLSHDMDRVSTCLDTLPDIWIGFYRLTVAFYLLYLQVGLYAVSCSLAWLLVFFPLVYWVYNKAAEASDATQTATDTRLRHETEFLQAIRALKIYGWITPFIERIKEFRDLELKQLVYAKMFQVASTMIWYNFGSVIVISVFGMRFLFTSDPLDAKTALTALMLIGAMHFPLSATPYALLALADGLISYRRVKDYLNLKERPTENRYLLPPDSDLSLEIRDGDVHWDGSETVVLRNLQLRVRKGEFVVILGKIGEGKSCLLETIIGEAALLRGTLGIMSESIAYASQVAWIQSKTIRENIIFGSHFDNDWYSSVIHACCLEPDFDQLHMGDQTLVGEQGINLSGGQKQRIALARAVYARADIVVLDDVLSAVDHLVAQKLLKRVFTGLLKDTTIILATHRLNVLSHATKILVLDNGQCYEFSSREEAFNAHIMAELQRLDAQSIHSSEAPDEILEGQNSPKKLLDTEVAAQGIDDDTCIDVDGSTRWQNLHTYITSSGGYVAFIMIVLLCFSYCYVSSFSGLYLSYYADHSYPSVPGYISAYRGSMTLLAFEGALMTLMLSFLVSLALFSRNGSITFHSRLIERIENARMLFYEKTPSGNILSRLSKDMSVLDTDLPESMMAVIDEIGWISANFSTIVVSSPLSLVFLGPLIVLLERTQRTYTKAYATVVRLTTALKSPVYTHVTETVNGLSVIRAFSHCDRFYEHFMGLLANRVRASHTFLLGNRWIGARMELANAIFTFCVALVAIAFANENRLTYLVFAITCASRTAYDLSWLVRQWALNDGNIVSISRLATYNKQSVCPQEPIVSNAIDGPFLTPTLAFENVSMRYAEGLPLVLKNVTFRIPARAKVGVIGRTGAGKTSILAALLRLVDIECGDIIVSGRSIYSMSIKNLRQNFAVIPQDPVLFAGTLRSNLDPLGEHHEKDISEALRRARLLTLVNELPDGLDTSIDSTGSTLSYGQRQLVCLARVLLKNSSIILMDEATSSVDPVTDSLIQDCIREEFADKTLVTIAHRIQTILRYDLLLGLNEGEVVEYDKPEVLMQNPNSLLSQMLGQTKKRHDLELVPSL